MPVPVARTKKYPALLCAAVLAVLSLPRLIPSHELTVATMESALHGTGETATTHSDSCILDLNLMSVIRSVWSQLDEISAKYPKTPVSGGIFLYPRQSAMLSSLIQLFDNTTGRRLRICETGFGNGHSAALFLGAADFVDLVTFDKFDRPYQWPSVQLLNQTFGPSRFRTVVGDSCQTVPQFVSQAQCDILHGSSLCKSDNLDLVAHSRYGAIITS